MLTPVPARSPRRLVWLALVFLLSGCVAVPATVTKSPTPTPPPVDPALAAEGWGLVWWDEFTGSRIDAARWDVLDESTFGEGNLEEACLLRENVAVREGMLVITARRASPAHRCGDGDVRFPDGRPYTSGFVQTRDDDAFTYGRFEIRASTPSAAGKSKGLWPAFWMRPVDRGAGELDVFEIVGTDAANAAKAGEVTQSIHFDYEGTHEPESSTVRIPRDAPGAFHRYAVEWEPGAIRWFVDDEQTFERTTATTAWLDEAFNREFFLRLNLAVGGRWPGSPDANTDFPAEYAIDYVRVYQR